MRKNIYHLFLATLYVVIGCGKKPMTKIPEKKISLSQEADERKEAAKFFSEVKAIETSCRGEDCPLGIVFVVSKKYTTGQKIYCTGLIIEDNRLVLPSDCIPQRILKEGANCRNSIIAKDWDGNRLYFCNEVLELATEKESANYPETWKADFVVLSFEGMRKKDRLNINIKEGLRKNRRYGLWHFTWDPIESKAILDQNSCYISYNNYAQPLGVDAYSPSLSLSTCENSEELDGSSIGGVVLREISPNNYQAYGIVNSVFQDFGQLLRVVDDFKGAALVQNFSCFPYFLKKKNQQVPNSCKVNLFYDLISEQRFSLLKISQESSNFQKFLEIVQKSYDETDQYLKWSVSFERAGTEITFIPDIKCFDNVDTWIRNFREGGVFGSRYIKKTEYKVEWGNFILAPFIDINGGVTHSLDVDGTYVFDIMFNPRSLVNTGVSKVTKKVREIPSGDPRNYGICE